MILDYLQYILFKRDSLRDEEIIEKIAKLNSLEKVKKELPKFEKLFKDLYPNSNGIYSDFDVIYKLYTHGHISCDIIEFFIQKFKGSVFNELNKGGIYGYAKVLYDGEFDTMELLLKYGLNINLTRKNDCNRDEFNLFSFVRMMLLAKPKTLSFDVKVLNFLIDHGIDIYSKYYKYYKFGERYEINYSYARYGEGIERNMFDYIIDAHIHYRNQTNGYISVLRKIFEQYREKNNPEEFKKMINSIDFETIQSIVKNKAFNILEVFIDAMDSTDFTTSNFYKKLISFEKKQLSNGQTTTTCEEKINELLERKTKKIEKELEFTISEALQSSSSDKSNEILNDLLPKINMKQKYPPDNLTPLFYLTKTGNIPGIKILSKSKDFNIDEVNEDGDTPLLYAIKNSISNKKLIDHLLSYNADVNHCNQQGKYPLYYVIEKKDVTLVRILLNHHPDIDNNSHNNITPIKLAILYNQKDIMKELLDYKKQNKK